LPAEIRCRDEHIGNTIHDELSFMDHQGALYAIATAGYACQREI
jgi:hypothetical protein